MRHEGKKHPSAVAVLAWIVAAACLAGAIWGLDGPARWVALAGYVVFQGVAIFYPRRAQTPG